MCVKTLTTFILKRRQYNFDTN